MKKTFETKYGAITIRDIMINLDGTILESGIELSHENKTFAKITDYSDMNKGLATIQGKLYKKWIKKKIKDFSEKIENVYMECSTAYGGKGIFSNGEAIYHKL